MRLNARVYKVSLLVLVLLLTAGSLAGCGGGGGKLKGKVITIATTNDPGTADGQMTTEEYFLPLNIFDRLVEAVSVKAGESKLTPGLAESWDVSADGKTYTFHIRKNVKFTNGEELTADDVLFTFDRMLDPATKALNTDFLDMIKGASDRLSGKAKTVSGITVTDKYTVKIELATPFAPFLANLATPGCGIYNRKTVTQMGNEKFGLSPVGTGPYKLKEWKVNSQVVLEANKNYWGGKPTLDYIVRRIIPDAETQRLEFEKGTLDVFDLDMAKSQIPYFKSSDKWKNQIVSGPRVGTYYYAVNTKVAPLDNVKVRQAFAMSIDRAQLLSKLYANTGSIAKGVLAPGLYGYDPNLPGIEYSVDKAKKLLTEAGYPNGVSFEIYQTVDSPQTLQINEAVQAMVAQAGIKVTIKQVDSAAWFGMRGEGKMPMYTTSWSADYNDPDNFLYTFFAPGNTVKRSFNVMDDSIFKALQDARTVTDAAKRLDLYHQVEKKVVYDYYAWVPLFHLDHLFVVQPRVKNFKVSWNGWSDMMMNGITVETK